MPANKTNGMGDFAVGPTDGNCFSAWSPPDTVENAHDLGNRPIYEAPVNNNAHHLTPAPEADR